MSERDWRELIELYWWDRYGPNLKRMNERTHREIEELAKRIAEKHQAEMAELEREFEAAL